MKKTRYTTPYVIQKYLYTRPFTKMTAVRIRNKLNIVTSELPQHEMFVNIFLSNMTEQIIKYEVSFVVLVYNSILKIELSSIISIGSHTCVCVNK
jgi:hypothetical protein